MGNAVGIGLHCKHFSHASLHKVPHAARHFIMSLAKLSKTGAGYQHQQHSVLCMNNRLHTQGRNWAAATGQHASSSADSVSMDTLRCKISDVPGASVDVMTDELLNLGALSARYITPLFMPSKRSHTFWDPQLDCKCCACAVWRNTGQQMGQIRRSLGLAVMCGTDAQWWLFLMPQQMSTPLSHSGSLAWTLLPHWRMRQVAHLYSS